MAGGIPIHGWLAGRLTDWMAGWPADWLVANFFRTAVVAVVAVVAVAVAVAVGINPPPTQRGGRGKKEMKKNRVSTGWSAGDRCP